MLLWRHILVDLWKQLVLTAGVLVAVISFSMGVKLMADGKIGPVDTLRFMVIATIPMLQYALPFAAGFASTMAYHRMTVDNEILASHAGGVSHRALLVPALASGVVLAGVLGFLANEVMPRFLENMERLIRQDAARWIVKEINRGSALKLDRWLVYADWVERLPMDPAAPEYERLWLGGVLVVQLGEPPAPGDAEEAAERTVGDDIELEGSAPKAFVWLRRTDASTGEARLASTAVSIRMQDFVGRRRDGTVISSASFPWTLAVPNALNDDPKFLGWKELASLRDRPERMGFVDRRRRRLATHLSERATTGHIQRELAERGQVGFVTDAGGRAVLHASAMPYYDPEVQFWVLTPGASGEVRLDTVTPEGVARVMIGRVGWLRTSTEPDAIDRELTVVVRLEDVQTFAGSEVPTEGSAAHRAGQRSARELAEMKLPESPTEALLALGTAELVSRADEHLGVVEDPFVRGPRDDLVREVASLRREVTSKQHERVAMPVACFLMVVMGGVMAMRLRHSVPLAVYLWSFFPALGAILTVSAGQQVAHDQGFVGLLVLWGGIAVMAGLTVVEYLKLAAR